MHADTIQGATILRQAIGVFKDEFDIDHRQLASVDSPGSPLEWQVVASSKADQPAEQFAAVHRVDDTLVMRLVRNEPSDASGWTCWSPLWPQRDTKTDSPEFGTATLLQCETADPENRLDELGERLMQASSAEWSRALGERSLWRSERLPFGLLVELFREPPIWLLASLPQEREAAASWMASGWPLLSIWSAKARYYFRRFDEHRRTIQDFADKRPRIEAQQLPLDVRMRQACVGCLDDAVLLRGNLIAAASNLETLVGRVTGNSEFDQRPDSFLSRIVIESQRGKKNAIHECREFEQLQRSFATLPVRDNSQPRESVTKNSEWEGDALQINRTQWKLRVKNQDPAQEVTFSKGMKLQWKILEALFDAWQRAPDGWISHKDLYRAAYVENNVDTDFDISGRLASRINDLRGRSPLLRKQPVEIVGEGGCYRLILHP